MNIKNSFLKAFVFYTLIPIALFVLFKNTLDKGILKYLVDSIFAACYPSSMWYDIAVISLVGIAIMSTMWKVFYKGSIPNRLFFICITSLKIYSIYRLLGTKVFYYTETTFCTQLKLADIVFFYPLTVIFTFIFQNIVKRKFKTESIENDGFTIDEPITINKDSDLLNRNKFIDVIANKIKCTKTENSSFAIGIVAKWGYGKTTFINTLLDKFDKYEAIKIELNVWKCNNNTQIIETLFKELRKSLKPYSFTIDNKLEEYAINLIKGTKSEHFNVFKNVVDLFVKDVSLAGQYDSINKEIKRINKRIIVVFDDLDRLDKKEIYEVIRLIRNTANFSNTFFIAAYDRTYILNAIQDINSYQTQYFLEKIFQLEFTLPPITDSVLENELRKRLFSFLIESDQRGFEKIKQRGALHREYGNYDLTSMFIHNLRDVVRFVNSFKLSYEFVKGEVYFPDFYSLELIRFKHPDLFLLIYQERDRVFTTDNKSNFNPDNVYHYSLKKELNTKDFNSEEDHTFLRNLIESKKIDFKLDKREIELLCLSYNSIFSESKNFLWDSRKKVMNTHLSVIIPSMYQRYFLLGIEGRLSEIEFSKIRQLPQNDFLKKIDELATSDEMIIELLERLTQKQQYDDKRDFENIVFGIFYVSNFKFKNRRNYIHSLVGFDTKRVVNIIGQSTIVARFYNSETDDYKAFLSKILSTDTNEYNFTNIFLEFLLRDGYYSIKDIFNSEEISALLFNNFENALNKSQSFNEDIWRFFANCKNRLEVVNSNKGVYINYPKNTKAVDLIKKFVWHNDLDNFIDYTVIQVHPLDNLYSANNDILKSIFGSIEAFVRALKVTKKDSPKIQEFIKYYDMVHDPKNNLDGVERSFFKEIKLKWESDNNE